MDSEEFWDTPTQVTPPMHAIDARLVGFYDDLAETRLACERLLIATHQRHALAMEAATRDLCTAFLVVSATVHLVQPPYATLEQQHEAILAFRTCQHDVLHLVGLVCRLSSSSGTGAPQLQAALIYMCAAMGFPAVTMEPPAPADDLLS